MFLGSTVTIILGKEKPPICPVFLLNKLIRTRIKLSKQNRKIKFEQYMPLSVAENGRIITRANMSKFLKTVLEKLGVDTTNFSF